MMVELLDFEVEIELSDVEVVSLLMDVVLSLDVVTILDVGLLLDVLML